MEGLIELVTASFLRHGIECPGDTNSVQGPVRVPAPSEHRQASVHETTPPAALPEHNYRKQSETDPAHQALSVESSGAAGSQARLMQFLENAGRAFVIGLLALASSLFLNITRVWRPVLTAQRLVLHDHFIAIVI